MASAATLAVMSSSTADPAEVAKFNALAAAWWAPEGPIRTLHEINPCRTEFVAARLTLADAEIVDIGCGGGVLTEALAARGARLTGIDAASDLIAVARAHAHAHAENLAIRYEVATAEAFAAREPQRYDAVVCMELIEHVTDPAALIAACRALLRADGSLFLSTLNRSPRAYLEAILGAEYVLRLLPIGTHDYAQFITPAELARLLRNADFDVSEICGMRYNPLTRRARLVTTPDVNYLLHARAR